MHLGKAIDDSGAQDFALFGAHVRNLRFHVEDSTAYRRDFFGRVLQDDNR